MRQAAAALQEGPVRQDSDLATFEQVETTFSRAGDDLVVSRRTERRVRNILVPTDFSPASSKALECAVALANQCKAALSILHVVDINSQAKSGSAQDLMRRLWEEGAAQVAQLAWRLSSEVEAQTILAEGLPWEVIVEKSQDFDLLVLGQSRAATGGKLFSQHTAQRVIKSSSCPVMVVHTPS